MILKWNIWCLTKYHALTLSRYTNRGCCNGIDSSLSSFCSQVISITVQSNCSWFNFYWTPGNYFMLPIIPRYQLLTHAVAITSSKAFIIWTYSLTCICITCNLKRIRFVQHKTIINYTIKISQQSLTCHPMNIVGQRRNWRNLLTMKLISSLIKVQY